MEPISSRHLDAFVGWLSLAYHEARNVRHLIRGGHLTAERFDRLRSLPTNRDDAWRAIQPVRQAAIASGDIDEAVCVFVDEFRLNIAQLVGLYRSPNWKGAAFGGNKWADITAAIEETYRLLRSGDIEAAERCLHRVRLMEHNTGRVGEKLERLDEVLRAEP